MKRIKWDVVLTIIISMMSVFVAWKAYAVCELQAQISKNSLLPNVQIQEYNEINETSYIIENSVIEIMNLEGRLNNYRSKIVTYLKCTYIDEENNCFEADVPAAYYYFVGNTSGNNIGIIETRRSMNNASKMQSLRKELLEYNEAHEKETIVMQQESCLNITYMDLLGDEQNLYYLTDISGVEMIDEQQAINIFGLQDRFTDLGYCLDFNNHKEITVESLIENTKLISNLSDSAETDSQNKTYIGLENTEVLVYIFSISFQVAGAMILLLFTLSTKRLEIIKRFSGTGMILRNGDTGELNYNENEFVNTFREGYLNKAAITFIAIGYFAGVFGEIGQNNRVLVAFCVITFTTIILMLTCYSVESFLKKSPVVNARITNKELEQVGIEPDMESISGEEISKMFQQEFKE